MSWRRGHRSAGAPGRGALLDAVCVPDEAAAARVALHQNKLAREQKREARQEKREAEKRAAITLPKAPWEQDE